jgi:hypothetical protein
LSSSAAAVASSSEAAIARARAETGADITMVVGSSLTGPAVRVGQIPSAELAARAMGVDAFTKVAAAAATAAAAAAAAANLWAI